MPDEVEVMLTLDTFTVMAPWRIVPVQAPLVLAVVVVGPSAENRWSGSAATAATGSPAWSA